MAGPLVILKAKREDSSHMPRLVIENRLTANLPEGGQMSRNTEDERFEAEEKDEVEGHFHGNKGKAMTDEPKADDDSTDDVEAHKHK